MALDTEALAGGGELSRYPARSENRKPPMSKEEFLERVRDLREMAARASGDDQVRAITSQIAELTRTYRIQHGIGLPETPLKQAQQLDPEYVPRKHLIYLSDQIARAVRRVEEGHNQFISISMPPRMGKTAMTSYHTPLWLLRRHPDWKIIMSSYSNTLTNEWAGNIRRTIEQKPSLGISLRPDSGAQGRWWTTDGGMVFATTPGGDLTSRGARVLIIDDPIKDYADAHSLRNRDRLWNWWLTTARTRLEHPYLVMVVMTRWHEDDFIGRLESPDYPGDPSEWTTIRFPALAETGDVLGRTEGDPLYSPLVKESRNAALRRWDNLKESVGSYTFSSMYQQRPAPAEGAIFDSSWWRFWTLDPSKATDDGRVVHIDPSTMGQGKWLDSWDTAFKGGETSDWVVGQRWVRDRANRYLIAQVRGRWTFTQTLAQMRRWAATSGGASPYGSMVHQRLIEDKANGSAIINTLQEEIAGIKPVNPKTSKEARARAITPEIESGNVYLPHPSDPGNEWVQGFLSEVRNFPHDAHDDQVDAMTQALASLRDPGVGRITVPGRVSANRAGAASLSVNRNIASAAMGEVSRRRGY